MKAILFLYTVILIYSKINMHEKNKVHWIFEAVLVNNLFSIQNTDVKARDRERHSIQQNETDFVCVHVSVCVDF